LYIAGAYLTIGGNSCANKLKERRYKTIKNNFLNMICFINLM
jgi:hypothetical protein